MIDLVLLGTGGGMPMPNRYLSSCYLNYKGKKILIDCGEGTQVSMRIAKCGFKDIDVICITHIHGDHIIGLPGLLGTIGNSGRIEPLTIIGPKGISEAINGLLVVCKYLPFEINIIENPRNFIFNQEVDISTLELDHSSPCLGYRFNIRRQRKFSLEKAIKNNVPKLLWNTLQKSTNTIEYDEKIYTSDMVLGEERRGLIISFVTDTRPIEEIKEFIKESDLFICEGTYGNSMDIEKAIKNKHMTFEEAANLAKDAKVKELLLTHFGGALVDPFDYENNAKKIFVNTIIGYDRYKKILKFT